MMRATGSDQDKDCAMKIDPAKRDAALLHLEQQVLNQVLTALNAMVEQSAFSRDEIAKRMDWSTQKLDRMLSHGEDWSIRTMGEMSYATGIEIEFEFRDGQTLVPGPTDPALALAG
jgi:aspartokinase